MNVFATGWIFTTAAWNIFHILKFSHPSHSTYYYQDHCLVAFEELHHKLYSTLETCSTFQSAWKYLAVTHRVSITESDIFRCSLSFHTKKSQLRTEPKLMWLERLVTWLSTKWNFIMQASECSLQKNFDSSFWNLSVFSLAQAANITLKVRLERRKLLYITCLAGIITAAACTSSKLYQLCTNTLPCECQKTSQLHHVVWQVYWMASCLWPAGQCM